MLLASKVVFASAAAALIGFVQDQPVTPKSDQKPADGQAPVVVIGPHSDIDLSGPRPILRGGLWRFDRVSLGGGRPFHFSTCLPTDDLESTLRRTAGERSNLPRANICGPLRITVGKGRISGRRGCLKPSREIGVSHSDLNLTISGRYDAKTMTVTMNANELTDGVYEGSVPRAKTGLWHITASRLGECPAKHVMGLRPLDEAVNLLFEPDLGEWDVDGI